MTSPGRSQGDACGAVWWRNATHDASWSPGLSTVHSQTRFRAENASVEAGDASRVAQTRLWLQGRGHTLTASTWVLGDVFGKLASESDSSA